MILPFQLDENSEITMASKQLNVTASDEDNTQSTYHTMIIEKTILLYKTSQRWVILTTYDLVACFCPHRECLWAKL